jgi:hypothetical protein
LLFLTSSDHRLYRVMPLKTPFGLLIPLLQSQSHITTITHNYFLCCYAFTQLQSFTFVTTITYYTLTLADFSAINYCLKLSHTLHLRTSKLSPRSYSANSLLRTRLENWLLKTELKLLTALLIQPSCVSDILATVILAAQQYCYVTSPTPVAVWQDGGSSPGNHVNTRDIPLLLKCDIIAAAKNCCLPIGYLTTFRCVIQQRVDMS